MPPKPLDPVIVDALGRLKTNLDAQSAETIELIVSRLAERINAAADENKLSAIRRYLERPSGYVPEG